MATRKSLVTQAYIFISLIIILIILTGCLSEGNTDNAKSIGVNINFVVSADLDRCPVSSVSLTLFDPTQGFYTPVQSILLNRDNPDETFRTTIQVPINSNIQYRYVINNEFPEISATGTQVLFRHYPVTSHAEILDTIAGWDGCEPSNKTGIIDGMLTSAGKPVQGTWIHAAGSWATSHSDGSFLISDLPEGIHTLSVFHPDGGYKPINTLVEIQDGKTTPVSLLMTEAKEVQITWIVTLPENSSTDTIVRFVSDHPGYGGMVFSDQWNGTTRSSNLPVLKKHDERTLYFSGKFFEGALLRYTYSLGDGVVGRETSDGELFTRHLIIPAEDAVYHDEITSFYSKKFSPKTFLVSVPGNTPTNDQISIQFNQNGWFHPISMNKAGENLWKFELTSGFVDTEPIQYRFCRNDLCDLTMESVNNSNPITYPLDLSGPSDIQRIIDQWQFIPPEKTTLRIGFREQVISRSTDFISGLEWSPCFLPNASEQLFEQGFQSFQNISSNLLVLRPLLPSTSATYPNRPNPSYLNSIHNLSNHLATQESIPLAVFPTPKWEVFQNPASYADWFVNYRKNILDYASLSETDSAKILILGGEGITPYLPPDPKNKYQSIAPGDADVDWINLVRSVKETYSGRIYFALPAGIEFSAPPLFLDEVDGIYFILDPGFYATNDLKSSLIKIIDGPIKETSRIYEKPVIIGFAAPSVSPKVSNQIAINESSCLSKSTAWMEWLNQYPVDLQIQLNTYQLILETINERDWIDGFIAQGTYPGTDQYDFSSSILGKPAFELLAYWNKNLLNNN